MIFSHHYVNLTILKFKTLMDTIIFNKKLKNDQKDIFQKHNGS